MHHLVKVNHRDNEALFGDELAFLVLFDRCRLELEADFGEIGCAV